MLVLYSLVKVVGFTDLVYPDSLVLSLIIMTATVTTLITQLTKLDHLLARS